MASPLPLRRPPFLLAMDLGPARTVILDCLGHDFVDLRAMALTSRGAAESLQCVEVTLGEMGSRWSKEDYSIEMKRLLLLQEHGAPLWRWTLHRLESSNLANVW